MKRWSTLGCMLVTVVAGIIPLLPAPAKAQGHDEGCVDRVLRYELLPNLSFYGLVCRTLKESEEFQQVCAKVPEEKRIKCDGSEPAKLLSTPAASGWSCLLGARDAGKETLQDIQDIGEAVWWLIKERMNLPLWLLKNGLPLTPWGRMSETNQANQATAKSPQSVASARRSSEPSKSSDSSSSSSSPSEPPSGLSITDDVATFAVHTVAQAGDKSPESKLSESEDVRWYRLVLMRDFWYYFADEIKLMFLEELDEFTCYNPRASDEYVCQNLTQWFLAGKLWKLAHESLASMEKGNRTSAAVKKVLNSIRARIKTSRTTPQTMRQNNGGPWSSE